MRRFDGSIPQGSHKICQSSYKLPGRLRRSAQSGSTFLSLLAKFPLSWFQKRTYGKRRLHTQRCLYLHCDLYITSVETTVHGRDGLVSIQYIWPQERTVHQSNEGRAVLEKQSHCVASPSVAGGLHGHGRVILMETQPGVIYIGSNWKQLRTVGRQVISTWTTAFLSVGGPVCNGQWPSQAWDLSAALRTSSAERAQSHPLT